MDDFCILNPGAKVRKLCMRIAHNRILVSRDAVRRPDLSQTVFILHISAVKKRLERLRSEDRNTKGTIEFYITQGNEATVRRILGRVAGAAVKVRDVSIDIVGVVGLKIRILGVLVKDKVGIHVR